MGAINAREELETQPMPFTSCKSAGSPIFGIKLMNFKSCLFLGIISRKSQIDVNIKTFANLGWDFV